MCVRAGEFIESAGTLARWHTLLSKRGCGRPAVDLRKSVGGERYALLRAGALAEIWLVGGGEVFLASGGPPRRDWEGWLAEVF